ncbi:hypothetical protein A3B21_00070 [Candidatus Uhrbacteria bacterium RIFCSPLOWO2_01_FULL_47_24]|uniref:Homing endonuclease LAGLIDADG domain-containing protein n=1 Tax=Candidatus Uhrbacteria bacterium RIFCSPLOWO2_01_FULL_47_24 TaxID=1802401 RepID=A0A1F7UVR7_9BACT|nr:MAG: hypothetical protein A2753_00360 [Candidatus Uhrbacteria bacterium RIFCSPHIGHO2_01_FULL_47_11]OGL69261.1 MAG: hypothetical protein A3D58_03125 [Candidatus Uhrbacteria bacterium RIFCSPHIGHO2_02_FULL_46_47]OGL76267.1 MAG: hypothetical protein A3F52_02420 [Candidatus Uhrbacteria bacterium RIFCSPHIGHO2_12_FULL_47_11]OGL81757.1 MAG: hypothetical protein A3B21_00070 [Candidatus Uhrbacteria bacterium RIFCSPLOWO2_01_FULL_47_24]OGL85391.1 MAG: hypothetical protein A3J03_04905 [Candidatus Uhrbact
MHSNAIATYKNKLKLTSRQQEILVGTLLGDGHLETQDHGRTYRLKIEHTLKQKEYVDWIHNEFREWVLTLPKVRERFVRLRSVSGIYPKYYFNTLSSGSFRFCAQQFYRKGNKVVPQLIHRWLTPLVLAVWYMDDGSIKSKHHRTVFLNTQGFDLQSMERLQSALLKKFGIKTNTRKDRDGMQLYVIGETIERFLTLIEPFVIPSMRYKLPKVWLTQLPKR